MVTGSSGSIRPQISVGEGTNHSKMKYVISSTVHNETSDESMLSLESDKVLPLLFNKIRKKKPSNLIDSRLWANDDD